MIRLIFTSLTGTPPYNVYVADERGNNETLVGTISSSIPPDQIFTPPSLFNNSPNLMVILEDSSLFRVYRLLPCEYNCQFSVYIIQNSI